MTDTALSTLHAAIDRDAVADLALRLVGAASLSGQEGEVAAIVRDALAQLGFDVAVDRYGNVTGTLDAGPGPCLLLDSHMDTVGVTDPAAWTRDPAGEIADGKLYGRGAMDMKGQLAACIHGIAALRGTLRCGRIVVSASIAEELAEGPALLPVLEAARPDRVVICEATGLRLARAQRGRAEIVVEVGGSPTHSARPELGVNAAEAMADAIHALRGIALPRHALLGEGILVLTDVISRPYPGLSVVPDRCVATYDRRTLPGESEEDVLGPLRAAVEAAVAPYGATGRVSIAVDRYDTYTGAHMEAPNFAPAWELDPDAPELAAALTALRAAGIDRGLGHWAFCTNGSGSAGTLGLTTLGFGPGDEELAHRVDEHMDLDELALGARGYAALGEALTGMA
ncbi:MAG TPA: YgeY family selenium metabolism-linked hydrolase [Solirubrobacter sp.]|nr:YgeY family selenium metabolism-linked hydrolase [Solirubrobacter sp.]